MIYVLQIFDKGCEDNQNGVILHNFFFSQKRCHFAANYES